MELYLASSFGLADRVRTICVAVKARGHKVPDQWWGLDTKQCLPDGTDVSGEPDETWYARPEVRAVAERHWRSIRACDAMVLVGPPWHASKQRFNGANVEVGFALGLGKPVLSVGVLERSAMYEPAIRCTTINELLLELDNLRGS